MSVCLTERGTSQLSETTYIRGFETERSTPNVNTKIVRSTWTGEPDISALFIEETPGPTDSHGLPALWPRTAAPDM